MSGGAAVGSAGDDTRCVELSLPGGDRARVALFGAQVLDWSTADGVPRLYLSPNAVFDGASPIRGGVPICFPQFNVRGPLPKHGIARTLPWQLDEKEDGRGGDCVRLRLKDSDKTRRWWPQAFRASVIVTLAPNRLRIAFEVVNSDSAPWTFTLALHSYLRVDAIEQARLAGLQGRPYWDALTGAESRQQGAELECVGPLDRVYRRIAQEGAAPIELRQPGGRRLLLSQSASFSEAVVWNPGRELGATLPDLPADGWRSMLCVEAAKVDAPVLLAPGQRWQGWQQFELPA